jgi:pseudaminic acid synthase
MSEFLISARAVGRSAPCYIIAEMSANHGQSFDAAIDLVRAAKSAGADAIKLQTYTPDTITIDSRRSEFLIGKGTLWEGRNLHDLYREAFTPWEWQPKLKEEAEKQGMHCFSTPFDDTAVDFLEEMNVPAYKIASFELVDSEHLKKVAATGKPVIMSTGMATLAEIDEAVRTLREAGCTQLALLKCTSAYPSLPEEMNLRTIPHLAEAFHVPVGLSDHTLGVAVPVSAVALGACIIEKHLTLRRSDGGPDAAFSLEPAEFRAMVDAIRVAENALGKVSYEMGEREQASRIFRRSLFVVKDTKAGEEFTRENVRSIRPGSGLPPKFMNEVLGSLATIDMVKGMPLKLEHISRKLTIEKRIL